MSRVIYVLGAIFGKEQAPLFAEACIELSGFVPIYGRTIAEVLCCYFAVVAGIDLLHCTYCFFGDSMHVSYYVLQSLIHLLNAFFSFRYDAADSC